jgi:hypothetical protein
MAARSVWPYRLNGSRSFSLSALCSSVSFLLSFALAFPARGFSWSKLLFFVVVSSSLARLRFPAPSSEDDDVDARGALSIDRNADWSIAETRWPGQLEERRAAAVVSSDPRSPNLQNNCRESGFHIHCLTSTCLPLCWTSRTNCLCKSATASLWIRTESETWQLPLAGVWAPMIGRIDMSFCHSASPRSACELPPIRYYTASFSPHIS